MAYAPGLRGDFIFDDFGSLPALGATGPVDNQATFWRYVTSGTADPTGRPLAMASFLIDAHDWPASPYPFKRTNVLLHILNGALLAFLLRSLLAARREPGAQATPSDDLASLVGAACWMLHPFLVSTTLYVVQREAMLPATFVLLGLLGWLQGRKWMMVGRIWAGGILIAASLVAGTLLAVMSKANGALLPLLALVIEWTWFPRAASPDRRPPSGWYRVVMIPLAWLPALAIIGYLTFVGLYYTAHGLGQMRDWTMAERLMSEPRAVAVYLRHLWLPTIYGTGLFNDDLKVSTSLVAPWTTFPSIAMIGLLLVLAWRYRGSSHGVALAVGFFLCGHLMESTTIPLELYYEHRNYLPSMLMFWPLALWLGGKSVPLAGLLARTSFRVGVAFLLIGMLGIMTWLNSGLWGRPNAQALLWASQAPESGRAQAYAAEAELQLGHPEAAIARLLPFTVRHPDDLQVAFNMLAAHCQLGSISAENQQIAFRAMRLSLDPGTLLVSWLGRATDLARSGSCRGLDFPFLANLIEQGLSNAQMTRGRRQDLLHMQGTVALASGDADGALAAFGHALDIDPRPDLALSQAASLGSAGYPIQGLEHLRYYQSLPPQTGAPAAGMPRIHAWVLDRQQYWNKEIAHLTASFNEDISALRRTTRTQ